MIDPQIRPARITDIGAIATVHEKAFTGFFLARMGASFLRAYYQLVLDYPGGLLLVTEDEDGLNGFVVGFVNPPAFYEYMSRMRRRLLWPSIRALLRRPSLVPRALFNRRRIEWYDGTAEPYLCELSSIAVLPGTSGRGLGGRLVEAFCDEAARRGCRQVVLTTDADENESVNAFYLRSRFVLDRTFPSGRKRLMNVYVRDLTAHGVNAPPPTGVS